MLKSIEQRYESAIKQMTPDLLEHILSQDIIPMKEEDEIIQQSSNNKSRKRQVAFLSAMGVVAAAVFLMFFINRNIVVTSISLDVNPSFEIQLNKKDEVKRVIGVNTDGKKVVEQAGLKDKNLEETIEELMLVLEHNGYLKSESAVLVSVQNKKEENAQNIEKKLKKQIKEICDNSPNKPKVYAQLVGEDRKVEEIAKSYHISKGRATFIYNMVEKNSEWKVEELASMSIEELVKSAEEKGVKVSEILEKKPIKEEMKSGKDESEYAESKATATPKKDMVKDRFEKGKIESEKSEEMTMLPQEEIKEPFDKKTDKGKDKNKEYEDPALVVPTEEPETEEEKGESEKERPKKERPKKEKTEIENSEEEDREKEDREKEDREEEGREKERPKKEDSEEEGREEDEQEEDEPEKGARPNPQEGNDHSGEKPERGGRKVEISS